MKDITCWQFSYEKNWIFFSIQNRKAEDGNQISSCVVNLISHFAKENLKTVTLPAWSCLSKSTVVIEMRQPLKSAASRCHPWLKESRHAVTENKGRLKKILRKLARDLSCSHWVLKFVCLHFAVMPLISLENAELCENDWPNYIITIKWNNNHS